MTNKIKIVVNKLITILQLSKLIINIAIIIIFINIIGGSVGMTVTAVDL